MPWLQVTLESTRDDARVWVMPGRSCAVSVSLEGADAEPLFEADWHDTTPVWKQTLVVALFAEDTDVPEAMRMVATLLSLPAVPTFKIETVADQDWVRVWMDRWQPLHFGANLWVVPSWLTPPDAARPTSFSIRAWRSAPARMPPLPCVWSGWQRTRAQSGSHRLRLRLGHTRDRRTQTRRRARTRYRHRSTGTGGEPRKRRTQ